MKINPIATGACIGIALGAATYMAATNVHYPSNRKRKMIKKRAEHAMNAVGSAVSDISHMIR